MTKTLPPNFVAWNTHIQPILLNCQNPIVLTYMAVSILLSKPVHSSTTVTGPSAVCFKMSACSFVGFERSMRTVRTPGTSFFANSSLLWTRSVMTMGSAPAALAERRETRPMGPAPLFPESQQGTANSLWRFARWDTYQIRTGSPNLSPERSIPARATARGSQSAPSSKETVAGSLWSHFAGWRCHRVKVPERQVERALRWIKPYLHSTGARTMERRSREKDDVRATIVASKPALIAGCFHTRNACLYGDAITWWEREAIPVFRAIGEQGGAS